MKRILGLIGAGGLALLAVTPTQADIVFATNPSGSLSAAGLPATVGTPFTVGATPVSITALGFFDYTGLGLTVAHEVGIYDLGQHLLGSVMVPAGSGVPYHDGTRWADLSQSIALAANTGYMLAFHVQGDPDNCWVVGPGNSVTIDPHFALAGSGYTVTIGSTLAYPGYLPYDIYLFGGNMAVSVPEPSQWAAMGLTLLGVAGYGFRRYQLRRTA